MRILRDSDFYPRRKDVLNWNSLNDIRSEIATALQHVVEREGATSNDDSGGLEETLTEHVLEEALQESNAAAPSTMPIVILQYPQNGGWFRYAFSKDPESKEKQAEKDSDL